MLSAVRRMLSAWVFSILIITLALIVGSSFVGAAERVFVALFEFGSIVRVRCLKPCCSSQDFTLGSSVSTWVVQ